jgi:hypothetical protein
MNGDNIFEVKNVKLSIIKMSSINMILPNLDAGRFNRLRMQFDY